ncbi:MAG: glycosyltransferase family A protein [Steroidobacteraceae bacterium]|jgi:glycosyltransferase involved in cell wall biosynthesis
MSTNTSVSCVIPVFNGERFLPEAIESVLAQGLADMEIIVVDDGSTDGTPDAAARFEKQVIYVRQDNAGPANARNHGIRRASGDFVAFLDSDDLWHPQKTAIQLKRFEARPELVICTAHMQNFWSAEVEHEVSTLQDGRLTEIQPNLGSSFIARRSLFETIGLLDIAFKHRDIQELMLRAVDGGLATECLPDVLVKRRIHDANISRHRSDAGDLELVAIARARIARRRVRPA